MMTQVQRCIAHLVEGLWPGCEVLDVQGRPGRAYVVARGIPSDQREAVARSLVAYLPPLLSHKEWKIVEPYE